MSWFGIDGNAPFQVQELQTYISLGQSLITLNFTGIKGYFQLFFLCVSWNWKYFEMPTKLRMMEKFDDKYSNLNPNKGDV